MLKSKMPAPVPQLLISTQLLTDSRGDTASCCSCWMWRQLYYDLFRSYLDFFDHDLTGCGANKTNCCSEEQKERRSLGFYFNPLKASDVLFISHNIDPISLFHFHGYVRESRFMSSLLRNMLNMSAPIGSCVSPYIFFPDHLREQTKCCNCDLKTISTLIASERTKTW